MPENKLSKYQEKNILLSNNKKFLNRVELIRDELYSDEPIVVSGYEDPNKKIIELMEDYKISLSQFEAFERYLWTNKLDFIETPSVEHHLVPTSNPKSSFEYLTLTITDETTKSQILEAYKEITEWRKTKNIEKFQPLTDIKMALLIYEMKTQGASSGDIEKAIKDDDTMRAMNKDDIEKMFSRINKKIGGL